MSNYSRFITWFLAASVLLPSPAMALTVERSNPDRFFNYGGRSVDEAKETFFSNIRMIEKKQALEHLQALLNQGACRRASQSDFKLLYAVFKPLLNAAKAGISLETNYILADQYLVKPLGAYGAINDVYGDPTWVVPREMGLAVLGLIQSSKLFGDKSLLSRAQSALDYLVGVQDSSDGGWYDQYSFNAPVVLSKSPTQTAEVMMAFDKMGVNSVSYASMKNGANYLLSLQNPANKGGNDDGLIGGGKDGQGGYYSSRWASDNSFAYLALKAAECWAFSNHDWSFANQCNQAASRILTGINKYLYINNPADPDYGVWRRVIDENHNTIDPNFHEWINYAPQMLDLPAKGVGNARVGEWIHDKFQQSDGSVVWNDGPQNNRKSPGFSFQAALVWEDLGQYQYAISAINWAKNSGLWQKTPDANGVKGGWIDWSENGQTAPWWQRFIDTSFYAMSAFLGGYNFRN